MDAFQVAGASIAGGGGAAPILNDAPAFVSMPLPPVQYDPLAICIEVRRGTTAMHVEWPFQAASDCTVWLRDWLR